MRTLKSSNMMWGLALVAGFFAQPENANARSDVHEPVLLSARQIEAFGHRSYVASPEMVRAAIISALHARNFINIKSDRTARTISAQYLIPDGSLYSAFMGDSVMWYANIVVEDGAPGATTIALKLLTLESRDGIFGGDATIVAGGPPVGVAQPYVDLYEAIDTELARLQTAARAAKASPVPAPLPPTQ